MTGSAGGRGLPAWTHRADPGTAFPLVGLPGRCGPGTPRAVLAARQLARPACRDRAAQAGQRERNARMPGALLLPLARASGRATVLSVKDGGQFADGAVEALAQPLGRLGAAVALGGEHLQQLVAPVDQRLEFLALGLGHLPGRRLDVLGKARQHAGVDTVGLGLLAQGAGEMMHLARIDYPHLDPGRVQRYAQRPRIAARGLQHHQRRLKLSHPSAQCGDPLGVVGAAPLFLRRQCHRQRLLGCIDSHERFHRFHPPLLAGAALPCAIRACPAALPRLFGLHPGFQGAATMLSHGLTRPRAIRPAAPISFTILRTLITDTGGQGKRARSRLLPLRLCRDPVRDWSRVSPSTGAAR